MNGRRYPAVVVAVLIGLAFVISLLLPKDHLAWPLGAGCYWSSTGLIIGDIQAQVCDDWRKPGSTLPVPNPN
jgi:hypothetical protein